MHPPVTSPFVKAVKQQDVGMQFVDKIDSLINNLDAATMTNMDKINAIS